MIHATLKSAVTGYVFSLLLSLEAYLFVSRHLATGSLLLTVICAAALVQLLVQLIFFLHITDQFNRRWNLLVLGFAVLIAGIIVGGSIWIMNGLSYQMTPAQMQKYITSQDSL